MHTIISNMQVKMSKVDGESHYTRKTLHGTWVFIHFSIVNRHSVGPDMTS